MSQERYSAGFRTHRREVKAEARNSGLNVRDYPSVRDYLARIIPNFSDRFSRYDQALSEWHSIRVQILGLSVGSSDYFKKANSLISPFQKKFSNPKDKNYDPNFWVNATPALREITNVVSKGR